MGPWMVFLCRIASCSLCDFINGNDHLVSMPFFCLPKRQQIMPKQNRPKQQTLATNALKPMQPHPIATHAVSTCGNLMLD
jgi:hypothetical protein